MDEEVLMVDIKRIKVLWTRLVSDVAMIEAYGNMILAEAARKKEKEGGE